MPSGDLQGEAEKWREHVAMLQSCSDRLRHETQDLETQKSNLKQEHAALQLMIQEQELDCTDVEKVVKAIQQQRETIHDECVLLEAERRVLSESLVGMRNELHQLQQQLDRYKNDLVKEEECVALLVSESTHLQAECSRYRNDLAKEEDRLALLVSESTHLQA